MENIYFELPSPRLVVAGNGVISEIPNLLLKDNCIKPLLITDIYIEKLPLFEKVRNEITNTCRKCDILSIPVGEPTDITILSLWNEIKNKEFDIIIGLGGGSVLDCSKLLAVFFTNTLLVDDMFNSSLIKNKKVKTLMIPTTAGTGAEATPNSIIQNTQTGIKIGIVSPYLIADYVILDSQVTCSLPKEIVATTGFDALAHAVECLISKKSSPFTKLYATESISLILNNLETAYLNTDNDNARLSMLLASYYGGISISSSSTNIVHAMAYPLSRNFHMSHALCISILLPQVIAYMELKCTNLFNDLIKSLRLQYNTSFSNSLFKLASNCQIPDNLSNYGVKDENIQILANEATNVIRLFTQSPVALNQKDCQQIYRKLLY